MILDFSDWPIWAGALLIFAARVADVTLGTLRISFISKGEKSIAPLIGFFEMLIWLFAISQLVQNLDNLIYYLAYAGGFATGIFCGLQIEDRIALGSSVIRTIVRDDAQELADVLRSSGFGVTMVRGEGGGGEVHLIFSVVKRSDVPQYLDLVSERRPGAFSTIEGVRSVREGVFRKTTSEQPGRLGPHRSWKSK